MNALDIYEKSPQNSNIISVLKKIIIKDTILFGAYDDSTYITSQYDIKTTCRIKKCVCVCVFFIVLLS